ncbi:PIG-L deacetylase family protein [Caldivirga maquilingensis]|uniref:LmbE family protein n=1 Tax=Caldivirga maquilingensis (strain ATCC 700844 / DSM 13496 / JCM 10307 / IC-167) TaxID=397948 RepID=A8MD17_CALMQ|nr:PIG-L deacetylase family protein [Caldivirga maquilingensis]ABW01673.1 LmbE family protein [Caldivirga maquilingensis IC-167]
MDLSKLSKYVESITIDEKKVDLLKRAGRVIAVSPHPDDIEIVAGGYLALLALRNASIKVIVVSDDRMSIPLNELTDYDVIKIRMEEEINAMRALGISNVDYLNYIDSEVPEPSILRRDLIRVFRSYGPDLVITVDPYLPYEAHPDHVNTGMAVLQAVLFHEVSRVMKEYSPKTPPPAVALGASHRPNALICIDDYVDRKMNALRAHKSQFNEELLRGIELIHMKLGGAAGCKYAEAFKVLTPGELHMNPLAEYS